MTCQGDNGECPEPVEKANLCRGHRERHKRGRPINSPLNDYGDAWGTFAEAAIRFANVDGFDPVAFKRAKDNLQKAAKRWIQSRWQLQPRDNVPPSTDS